MDWDTALFYAVNGWAGQSSALDWLMLQCSSARNFIVLVVAYLAYRVWIDWRHGMLVTSVLGVPCPNQAMAGSSAAVSGSSERP